MMSHIIRVFIVNSSFVHWYLWCLIVLVIFFSIGLILNQKICINWIFVIHKTLKKKYKMRLEYFFWGHITITFDSHVILYRELSVIMYSSYIYRVLTLDFYVTSKVKIHFYMGYNVCETDITQKFVWSLHLISEQNQFQSELISVN